MMALIINLLFLLMKFDVFYGMVTKKAATSLLLSNFDIMTGVFPTRRPEFLIPYLNSSQTAQLI